MNTKPSDSHFSEDELDAVMETVNQLNKTSSRYHPALVSLHWLLALLILLALAMGTFLLKEMPNTSPDKIGALRGHMIMGFVIGALMLIRLVIRNHSSHPYAASTGNALLDQLRKSAHTGLYVLILAMAASGVAIALLAGLPEIVFTGGAGVLPENFASYPPRTVHGWIAKALMALIGLHLAGVVYHQFALKDRLLSRMWFGNR
jgi:cytochrome b561